MEEIKQKKVNRSRISMRIPTDLRNQIVKRANDTDKSMSIVIIEILKEFFTRIKS